MPITHKYTSTKTDPSDTSLIGASKWNDTHTVTLSKRVMVVNGAITSSDESLLINGGVTATLPDATTVDGQLFRVKRIDSGSSLAKVVTTGGQLIDSLYSEIDLTNQNQFVVLQADSSNACWWVMGLN